MDSKNKTSIDSTYQTRSRHRFLKLLFLVSIIGILGTVFVWSYLTKLINNWNFSSEKIKIDGIDFQRKEIKNPRFLGGKDQPYTITAKLARQIAENKVHLETVTGKILLKDNTSLFILADQADLTTDQSKLVWLQGNVNFLYTKGNFKIDTNSAFGDLNKGYLEGKEFLDGESDHGLFEAQGFYLDQQARTLKLKGPAKLVMYSTHKKKMKEK